MKYILLLIPFLLVACGLGSSLDQEAQDQAAVQEQQSQYAVSQPVPRFNTSLERGVVIQLYQARNTRVATHTVWRSDFGMVEGECPSIGYPIPYDTSLTNPQQALWDDTVHGYTAVTLGQAEPNGLFASQNSIATWVRCIVMIDGIPKEVPVYIESRVTAYPYTIEVDYGSNRVIRAGNSAPGFILEN